MHIDMRRGSYNFDFSRGRGKTLAVAALLIVVSFPGPSSLADDDQGLEIRAASASVAVSPGRAGRRSLPLPALEFVLEVAYRCEPGYAPASLSLTAADTRTTLDASDLAEEAGKALMDLVIPANQLPPLILSDFCTADDSAAGTKFEERLIEGIATVSASLRCESESGPRASYASTTLDVSLACELPAADTAE